MFAFFSLYNECFKFYLTKIQGTIEIIKPLRYGFCGEYVKKRKRLFAALLRPRPWTGRGQLGGREGTRPRNSKLESPVHGPGEVSPTLPWTVKIAKLYKS